MIDKRSQRQVVLGLLRGNQPTSRPRVAEALAVSLPTAGSIVKQMLRAGLAIETGRSRSSGGRPAQLVQLNPDYAHAVGLTISSRVIQSMIVDMVGRVIWQGQPTTAASTPDQIMQQASDAVSTALDNASRAGIRGVGVGVCGVVDGDSGVCRTFPQIRQWKDVPVADMLASRFRLPVAVYNEVQAATLAELHYGCGREADDLLYLHVGKGIGLGLVSQGQLLRGSHGHAGEIGHTVVDPKGPVCYCGNYGCLESLASPPAIVRDAAAAIRQGVTSDIAPNDAAALDRLTVQDIFAAAQRADRLACNLLTAAGEHVGGAVANVANIFNPKVLVLGGLLCGGPPMLVDAITRVFSSRLLPALVEGTAICTSQILENGCALGAATAIFDRLLQQDDVPILK